MYENIPKVTTVQGNDHTTSCLLHYNYLKKHKMIAIDLSKQQELDANPKAIQQITFTGNRDGANRIFFIIADVKKTISDSLQETMKVLQIFLHDLAWAPKVFGPKGV